MRILFFIYLTCVYLVIKQGKTGFLAKHTCSLIELCISSVTIVSVVEIG